MYLNLEKRVELKKAYREELYCLEPPFPITNFLIEISNACNHECLFCTHQKMKRKVGTIDKNLLYDILKQAYDLGTREVGFYATGEPFLTNALPDFVAKAKDLGYEYVYITSNGSLATPSKIKKVVDSGVDSIKFSINATDREMYKFIHGKDDFDTVIENLKYVKEYREITGKKYKIFITSILTRYTEDKKDEYGIVFKGLSDEIVFKQVYNQGGTMPEIDKLLRCKDDDEEYRRCNLPFDAVTVTNEGYLTACNADFECYLVVADLNKVSLKDGWYGEKMKHLRQGFMDDKLENTLCDGCIHHAIRDAKPLMPEYATTNDNLFDENKLRDRIKEKFDV